MQTFPPACRDTIEITRICLAIFFLNSFYLKYEAIFSAFFRGKSSPSLTLYIAQFQKKIIEVNVEKMNQIKFKNF